MNKQIYLGALVLMNVAVQAADGKLHIEESDGEWVTLPVNPDICGYNSGPLNYHGSDYGEIRESVNLEQHDNFTHSTYAQLIENARQQDMPWILAAYYCLSESAMKRRYADAKKLYQWRPTHNVDPVLQNLEILTSDYYGFEYVNDRLNIEYLGTDRESTKKGSLLNLLLSDCAGGEKCENCLFSIAHHYGAKKDIGRTEKWLKKAVKKSHVGAMFELGKLYFIQGKEAEAEPWLLKAAEKDCVEAMRWLGALYWKQSKQDVAEKWLLKAAERGYVSAMCELGNLYLKEDKKAEAEFWLLKAAKKDHTMAMAWLGGLYLKLEKQDKAGEWLHKAEKKGSVYAMTRLGILCSKQHRDKETEEWYLKAADKGSVVSMLNLGGLYLKQEKQNQAEGLLRKAVEKRGRGIMDLLLYIEQNFGHLATEIEKAKALVTNYLDELRKREFPGKQEEESVEGGRKRKRCGDDNEARGSKRSKKAEEES